MARDFAGMRVGSPSQLSDNLEEVTIMDRSTLEAATVFKLHFMGCPEETWPALRDQMRQQYHETINNLHEGMHSVDLIEEELETAKDRAVALKSDLVGQQDKLERVEHLAAERIAALDKQYAIDKSQMKEI